MTSHVQEFNRCAVRREGESSSYRWQLYYLYRPTGAWYVCLPVPGMCAASYMEAKSVFIGGKLLSRFDPRVWDGVVAVLEHDTQGCLCLPSCLVTLHCMDCAGGL